MVHPFLWLTFFLTFTLIAHADPSVDQRVLIPLPYKDREIFLKGMRQNLVQVSHIWDSLFVGDFESIEREAAKMLLTPQRSNRIARRGNADFIKLGVQFHAVEIVDLIRAARQKDKNKIHSALKQVMNSCNSCHATYKVTEWPKHPVYKPLKPVKIEIPPGYIYDDWKYKKKDQDKGIEGSLIED